MKILFLHLSDLHIKTNQQINMKVNKIIEATQIFGNIDKRVIICSGDLSYSGTENEYKSVRRFFGTLMGYFNEAKDTGFIDTIVVPGNHDMNIKDGFNTFADIAKIYQSKKKGAIDEAFYKEIELQTPFLDYAKSKNCFNSNKIIDSQVRNYKGYRIQYNLLNTAPFCRPKENVKGMLYFPDDALYCLNAKNDANLSITIMHHGTDWFYLPIKNALESKLNLNADIVFQGHEHIVGNHQIDGVRIIKGGEYSGDSTHKSTFSALLLNTEDNLCSEAMFRWDEDNTIFLNKDNIENFHINHKPIGLLPDDNFKTSFLEDKQGLSQSVLDYFIFPKLKQYGGSSPNDDVKIINEDDFWNVLFANNKINIAGKNRSGKTTLLKYIYMECFNRSLLPIFITQDHNIGKLAVDRAFSYLIDMQYGEQSIVHALFEQYDWNKKVILVDDFDSIVNKEKVLNALESKGCIIIYSSKIQLDLDLKNATKNEVISSKYVRIEIEDFYKEKRGQLIRKLCVINNQNSDFTDYTIKTIDYYVTRRNGLFVLSPEYIVQYIKYFTVKDTHDFRGEGVFNVVFETNLRNSILEFSGEKHIEICLLMLEEIAFHVHSNKNEIISLDEMSKIVNDLNIRRALEIDTINCINIISKAKIIDHLQNTNDYMFANKNYLAYFIAKKVNNLIEKKGFEIPELNYVINNICFGINDNILLFLSYLRSNTTFAQNTCIFLDDILKQFDELDFDKNNISFIKKQKKAELKLPDKYEKEEDIKASDFSERQQLMMDEKIQYKNIYGYDEAEVDLVPNKLIKAMKYLEIISKSLISHWVNLERSEKQYIVDLMYSAPNKILYALLKPYDENYDLIINEIYDLTSTVFVEFNIGREEIEEAFNKLVSLICLGLYDNVAFLGANSDTMLLLNSQHLRNSNYKIENLLMEENGSPTVSFVDKAIKLMDTENDIFIKNLIQRITRKHVIENEIQHSQLDRIASKILYGVSKQNLLISSKINKK